MDILRTVLSQDEPISWALENLELIGRGSISYVFAHPSDPGAAIKLTEDPDMWFWYAHCLDDIRSPHAPIITQMATFQGHYAAVLERLVPLDEASEAIVAEVRSGQRTAGNASIFEFLEQCPVSANDLRDENWMLRGSTIVLTDPNGQFMAPRVIEEFEQIYRLENLQLAPSP